MAQDNPGNSYRAPLRPENPADLTHNSEREAPVVQVTQTADGGIHITTPAIEAQRRQEAQAQTQVQTVQPDAPAETADGSYSWGGYMQAIGITGLLLVGLWLLLKMVRSMNKNRTAPSASSLSREEFYIEGQLPLGQNKGLYVVRFLNTRLVLGVTDQQINLLSEAEANSDEQTYSSFQQVMESIRLQAGRSAPGQSADAVGSAKPGPGAN